MISEQEKVKDFQTHLNYLIFLNTIPEDLKIESNLKLDKKISFIKEVAKKSSLIKLTEKSLKHEQDLIHQNPEYALMCVPWISIKAYYLNFYLLQVLKYLITGDEKSFITTHSSMAGWFKKMLSGKTIQFNFQPLNQSMKLSDVLAFKAIPGANLKTTNFDPHERYHQVLKKLALYKIEEFKQKNKITANRKKSDQIMINEFKNSEYIIIFEFFWLYRIKASYRDLEFLEASVTSEKLVEFYCMYFMLTSRFAEAIKELINEIALKRFKKSLF